MQKRIESIGKVMVRSIVDSEMPASLIDFAEAVLDSSVSDPVVKQVPIIGAIVGFAKSASNFRDKMFARKIIYFLQETSKVDQNSKDAFRDTIDADPQKWSQVGEVVLEFIDKVIGQEKASMLGKVFKEVLRGKISADTAVNLSEIINRANIEDLRMLSKGNSSDEAHLESVGIRKPIRHEDIEKALTDVTEEIKEQMPIIKSTGYDRITRPRLSRSGYTQNGYLIVTILQDIPL